MNMLNVLIFSHKINFMKKMYFTLVNYYDPIIIHLYHSPILITLQVNHDIYMLITTISSIFCMQKGAKSISLLAPFISTAVSICYVMLFYIISSPLVASIMQFVLSFLHCRVVLFRT